ncbi:unnamed protein product, partial [Meganyctiphanes norvegica]
MPSFNSNAILGGRWCTCLMSLHTGVMGAESVKSVKMADTAGLPNQPHRVHRAMVHLPYGALLYQCAPLVMVHLPDGDGGRVTSVVVTRPRLTLTCIVVSMCAVVRFIKLCLPNQPMWHLMALPNTILALYRQGARRVVLCLTLCHIVVTLTQRISQTHLTGSTSTIISSFVRFGRIRPFTSKIPKLNIGGLRPLNNLVLVKRPSQPDIIDEDSRQNATANKMIFSGVVALQINMIQLIFFCSKFTFYESIFKKEEKLKYAKVFLSFFEHQDYSILLLTFGNICTVGWNRRFELALHGSFLRHTDTMWVALVTILVSSVASFLTGRLTDLAGGYLRGSIIALLLSSSLCFFWFLLISHGYLAPDRWQIYLSIIGGCSCSYGTIPLFFEMGAELTYPVPEIMMSGILTAADNLTSIIFLLGYLVPGIGYQWVTYALVGCNGLMVIPMLLIKIDYTRAKVDSN